MSVQELLKSQAIDLGLCQQWQDEWGNPNVDDLCRKFIRGIDFCIKHDFPKVEQVNTLFQREDLERNGIYSHPNIKSVSKGQKDVVSMGDSVVDVYVPDHALCDIYVRHNSRVNLHVGENAFVYVTMRDNGTLEVVHKGAKSKIKSSYFSGTFVNKEQLDTIHYK